jgi:carbohydrate-selective porin OprB
MKTLAFFFALTLPLLARLGETVAQCEARYGPDLYDNPNEGWYEKNGINVHADFRDGAAVKIVYWKKSEELFSRPKLSDLQVAEILKANSGGQEWMEVDGDPGFSITGKKMKRKDGSAWVTWDYLSGEIRFIADSERKLEADQEAAVKKKEVEAQKQAVQGF